MGTIVSFHAHPDDESIATSGVLALAADAGHRDQTAQAVERLFLRGPTR